MKLSKEKVERLIGIAALQLTSQEKKTFHEELEAFAKWVETLKHIETQHIQPLTNMSFEVDKLSQDTPVAPMAPQELFLNAPVHNNAYFHVPSIEKK